MDMDEKKDMMSMVFDSMEIINGMLENLKKEMLEVIFSNEMNLFKKAIFIQGVFSYVNSILAMTSSLNDEEKNKKISEFVNISMLLNENIDEDTIKFIN